MFSYLYDIDQLFSELYLCYIFVLYLYVFVYIYGWYMDQSQKIKNLLKKKFMFRAGYLKKPVLMWYFITIAEVK